MSLYPSRIFWESVLSHDKSGWNEEILWPTYATYNKEGHPMNSLVEVVNNAMWLMEEQSQQLARILPKSYTDFSDGRVSDSDC